MSDSIGELNMTPAARLIRTMLIATIMGGLIAGASGYGLVGTFWSAVIVGSACTVAMLIVLAVQAHDRRLYRREAAHWNRRHPSISPTQSRSVDA